MEARSSKLPISSSLVEPGVVYPREVAPPIGLPPGWKAIERAYGPGSKSAGKTYTRYDGPNGVPKTLSSVKLAIERDCEARGLDLAEALVAYEKALEEDKERKQQEREASGHLVGEKREEAISAFHAKYGTLDGCTVAMLPGWKGKVGYSEGSGQTHVIYISPDLRSFGTIRQIEAFFGARVLAGEELSLVGEARAAAKAKYGDYPPSFNPLRRTTDGGTIKEAVDSGVLDVAEVQQVAEGNASKEVSPDDYCQSDAVAMMCMSLQSAMAGATEELRAVGAVDAPELACSCKDISEALLERRFEKDVEILAVFRRAPQKDDSQNLMVIDCVRGVYVRLPESFQGRSCYQRVLKGPTGPCGHKFLVFWSAARGVWKLGELDDSKAGLALSEGFATMTSLEQPWKLLTDACAQRQQHVVNRRRDQRSRSSRRSLR